MRVCVCVCVRERERRGMQKVRDVKIYCIRHGQSNTATGRNSPRHGAAPAISVNHMVIVLTIIPASRVVSRMKHSKRNVQGCVNSPRGHRQPGRGITQPRTSLFEELCIAETLATWASLSVCPIVSQLVVGGRSFVRSSRQPLASSLSLSLLTSFVRRRLTLLRSRWERGREEGERERANETWRRTMGQLFADMFG